MTYSDTPDPTRLPVKTRFLGGAVCLDFANTTEMLRSATPNDWLTSYEVLLVWSRARDTLSAGAIERLSRRDRQHPAAADEVFARSIAIRSDIRDLGLALAGGRVAADILRRINPRLAGLPPQPAIKAIRNRSYGRFALRGDRLDEPLWPILWSLTALLTSPDAGRVGRCEGHGCGYLFIDTTLNRSRRFCSTEGCGNRTRVRRHYERQHSVSE